MWNRKKNKFSSFSIFLDFFFSRCRENSLQASFKWSNQPCWELCGWGWIFFCYKTCNSTSNEGGKQLSNDHHIREIFPQIHAALMLWLPAVWPIKKLTLHNTHQGKRGEMENFRLFVGCYVRRTLYSTKHFTDRRPSAKVPVAPKNHKTKGRARAPVYTNFYICRRK
jgi:hypothetical protein